MRIVLKNSFHRTEVSLNVDGAALAQGGADLTPSQVARCRRTLCGMSDCSCGDDLGLRGAQDVTVATGRDRDYHLTATVWGKP